MPRISSFMIPADDLDRAVRFYREVFAWRFEAGQVPGGSRYWNAQTGESAEPGIDGVVLPREFPGQPIGVSLEVASVDEYVGRVARNGGKILVGKAAIPGVCWFAVCQDPEGNTFILMQPDESARLSAGPP